MIYESKPKTNIMDAETKLLHFALITFYVDPHIIRSLIHDRFQLNLIKNKEGEEKALLSVVPFLDKDFYIKGFPVWKHSFGQTNYRVYVKDTKTNENVVWFLGTTLDSIWNFVPKKLWKLPWHRGSISFECNYDEEKRRYTHYSCKTTSIWADNEFEIEDSGELPQSIAGFDSVEKGLFFLSHPLIGYYYKKNGKVGSYSVWHRKLKLTIGSLSSGNFGLLRRLNLWNGDLKEVQSVLLTPQTNFTIYLPPKTVSQ